MSNIYQILKKNKICVRCRRVFVKTNKAQCNPCLKYSILRSANYRKQKNRCSRCGSKKKDITYKTCDKCRNK